MRARLAWGTCERTEVGSSIATARPVSPHQSHRAAWPTEEGRRPQRRRTLRGGSATIARKEGHNTARSGWTTQRAREKKSIACTHTHTAADAQMQDVGGDILRKEKLRNGPRKLHLGEKSARHVVVSAGAGSASRAPCPIFLATHRQAQHERVFFANDHHQPVPERRRHEGGAQQRQLRGGVGVVGVIIVRNRPWRETTRRVSEAPHQKKLELGFTAKAILQPQNVVGLQ